MSDALPLPPRPNLQQYKKLAKDFQDACKSGDPGAVRQCAARLVETLARLEGVAMAPQAQRDLDRKAARIEQHWHKFKETHGRASECALTAVQFFIAREHGFTSWPKFASHVQALGRANSPVSTFEEAADAIVSGDISTLRKLLADHAELVRERSTREHRSTLLHYVSANGVEDYRQKTPKNIVEIANVLLDAGADVNAESYAYGGCTALGLVATSVHPEEAGVQIALLQALLDRGARLDHPYAGGNGQSIVNSCLANGQPGAAEFLARLGAPLDLEAAAGVGRLNIVKRYFEEDPGPREDANQKQIVSAFLYACGYGRTEVVEYLLERGVDPGSQNDDGQTGLHWAQYAAHVQIVKVLLKHGAPIDVKDKRHRSTPLDVALYVWNHPWDKKIRERCYEVIARLARAGAKLDPEQWRNADEDRSEMLEKIGSDPRMLAALRGEITG